MEASAYALRGIKSSGKAHTRVVSTSGGFLVTRFVKTPRKRVVSSKKVMKILRLGCINCV
jgi:hypothetical protein